MVAQKLPEQPEAEAATPAPHQRVCTGDWAWGHPTLSLSSHLWDMGPPEQAGWNWEASTGERGGSNLKEGGLVQRKLSAWKGQDIGAAHSWVLKETKIQDPSTNTVKIHRAPPPRNAGIPKRDPQTRYTIHSDIHDTDLGHYLETQTQTHNSTDAP